MEEHNEILELLRENNKLAKEDHEMIKKMYRHGVIGFWMRMLWYGILIGLPFAVYFYFLQPYFEAFGSNYELFRQGMAEIPGLKGLENLFPSLTQ